MSLTLWQFACADQWVQHGSALLSPLDPAQLLILTRHGGTRNRTIWRTKLQTNVLDETSLKGCPIRARELTAEVIALLGNIVGFK